MKKTYRRPQVKTVVYLSVSNVMLLGSGTAPETAPERYKQE